MHRRQHEPPGVSEEEPAEASGTGCARRTTTPTAKLDMELKAWSTRVTTAWRPPPAAAARRTSRRTEQIGRAAVPGAPGLPAGREQRGTAYAGPASIAQSYGAQ